MAIYDVDIVVYIWAGRIVSILSTVFAISTLCFHCIQVSKFLRNKKNKCTSSIQLSIILHILIIFQNGISSFWFNWFEISSTSICAFVTLSGGVMYNFSKWSLYMTFSFRLGMYCTLAYHCALIFNNI